MISIDMKEQMLTVIGTVDPVDVVSKLRKLWRTEITSIGPAKEPEKKEETEKKEEPKKEGEPKKEEEAKKEEPKKEEAKKEEPEKKEETEKKEESPKKEEPNHHEQMIMELVKAYKAYHTQMNTHYYVQAAPEENSNSCVIC